MDASSLITGLFIGGATAGTVAWNLRGARAQQRDAAAQSELHGRTSVAETMSVSLREQLKAAQTERDASRGELLREQEQRVTAETRAVELTKHVEEQRRLLADTKAQLADQFKALSDDALKSNNAAFLQLAHQTLKQVVTSAEGDLGQRQEAIKGLVKPLEESLARYEQLMKKFESERENKYGRLENELHDIKRTAANLVAVLGNSRVRGQWGQKMAEDILRMCGLQEGLHYRKEQEIASGRPDYTFMLPEQHCLFMDVKFPLDHYWRSVEAESVEEQQRCKEAFVKSVREHLREMDRRAYGADDRSLDYTILFIPNEQVYTSVNEWIPLLIDECLQKKLILCGPWTLYAVIRIIHQAWQNYQFSTAVHDIVRAINGFKQDYGIFKKRFEELGDLLGKLDTIESCINNGTS